MVVIHVINKKKMKEKVYKDIFSMYIHALKIILLSSIANNIEYYIRSVMDC